MRFAPAILALSSCAGWSEIRDVVKSREIDRTFAGTTGSVEVLAKTNYAVEFRVTVGNRTESRVDTDADEFWFIRRGSAKISLGDRHHEVNAGDVVSVPRSTAYQIAP